MSGALGPTYFGLTINNFSSILSQLIYSLRNVYSMLNVMFVPTQQNILQ